jgi:hypothetical protein
VTEAKVHGPKFPGWIAVDSNDPNSARIRYFPPTVVQNKRGFMGLACWAQQYQCGTSINFSLFFFLRNEASTSRFNFEKTPSNQKQAKEGKVPTLDEGHHLPTVQ